MTADLAARLVAPDGPIAEDERVARVLLRIAQNLVRDLADYVHSLGRVVPGWDSWPGVERLCERTIAECAAKRAIVEAYIKAYRATTAAQVPPGTRHDDPEMCERTGYAMALRYATEALAQSFAGRPGWRDEWAT